MNYEIHYNKLIDKAKNRNIDKSIYVEHHHIIPRCLGGNNKKSNKVVLLPEEHYVAHQLLHKMHPAHNGLAYALHIMTVSNPHQDRSKNKEYSWVRKAYSNVCKKRKMSDETKIKFAAWRAEHKKGRTYEEQYGIEDAERLKRLKSEQLSGRKIDLEITKRQVATRIKNGNHLRTNESKAKIRAKRKLQVMEPRSEATKAKISAGLKLAYKTGKR